MKSLQVSGGPRAARKGGVRKILCIVRELSDEENMLAIIGMKVKTEPNEEAEVSIR